MGSRRLKNEDWLHLDTNSWFCVIGTRFTCNILVRYPSAPKFVLKNSSVVSVTSPLNILSDLLSFHCFQPKLRKCQVWRKFFEVINGVVWEKISGILSIIKFPPMNKKLSKDSSQKVFLMPSGGSDWGSSKSSYVSIFFIQDNWFCLSGTTGITY